MRRFDPNSEAAVEAAIGHLADPLAVATLADIQGAAHAVAGRDTALFDVIVDELEGRQESHASVTRTDSIVRSGVFAVAASTIVPEDVDYLDEPWVPLRTVTLMTGIDGVGKSTILSELAARATRGALTGVLSGQPVSVVIASSEDHAASVIIPRLMAAGADLDLVHLMKVRRHGFDGDIALPDDLPGISSEVRRVVARLLIIDPLYGHLPLSIDSHKAQHIRSVFAPLAHLAEEENLAVAAVVHFNGSPSTDVRTRISGSKALRDASRSVIVCAPDPGDDTRFVMVQNKNSYGPLQNEGLAYRIQSATIEHTDRRYKTSKIEWLGPVPMRSSDLLTTRNDEDRDAATWLHDILSEGPLEHKDVQRLNKEAHAFVRSTLHAAKKILGVIVDRDESRQGRPSTWRLPFVRPAAQPGTSERNITDPTPNSYNESDRDDRGLVRDTEDRTKPLVNQLIELFDAEVLDPAESKDVIAADGHRLTGGTDWSLDEIETDS
jgi:hypothetical protein